MTTSELSNRIYFLSEARNIAKLSSCVSFKVGCVIVKHNKIISSGFNDALPGIKKCNETFDEHNFNREEHHLFSERHEIHAEQQAIINALNNNTNVIGADLYCTLQPCYNCLKLIIAAGIKNIYFDKVYDKVKYTDTDYEILNSCNVSLFRFIDNQFIQKTNKYC